MSVYLDHNGTTPTRPEVRRLWEEQLDAGLGNPSATHASGRRARAVVDEAREQVAAALGVPEEWVLFTSGGTESNNGALHGVLEALGGGLAIGATEHSSVLETAAALARGGHRLWTLPVDAEGIIELEGITSAAAEPDCRLLSVMTANNEVGSLAPMEAIAGRLQSLGEGAPVWHTDAVQALGKVPLELRAWGVDLASLSAHKVGGPQGVGILVRRAGLPFAPVLHGGGQEHGLRSGTENVAGIAAAALAVELAVSEQEGYDRGLRELSTALWEGLVGHEPDLRLLGPAIDAPTRLPNTLCVAVGGVDGRTLLARLDLEGVEASLGSACSSGAIEASHVLLAMGRPEEEARAGLRLSLGRTTTTEDIHSAVEIVGTVLRELRARN